MKWMCAEFPAVTFSGMTGDRARSARSTARCTCENRENVAAGYFGLKIVPSGAITFSGLSIPSFCGTKTGNATSSRNIILVMNVNAETVVPSNAQLYAVGTCTDDQVRSYMISSTSTITLT